MARITSRKELLMESLESFFNNPEHVIKIIPIIMGNRKISLRIIDWFVTNYSKKNNTTYFIDKNKKSILNDISKYEPGTCDEFIVYINYKLQLKAYSKKQFDPFCRRSRIDYYYNKHNLLDYIKKNNLDVPNIKQYLETNDESYFTTTTGQLNFFRWIINNKIIDYILLNIKEIDKDMNTSYRKQYPKKRDTSSRKKRNELSLSATKSLSKSNVNVIVTFN